MADYIERQAIYKKIAEMEESARNCYLDTPWDSPARERYRTQLNERTALKHMIADEPAANVREDLQGEWLDTGDHTQIRYCSQCGVEFNLYAYCKSYYNFCPNCGARMKL